MSRRIDEPAEVSLLELAVTDVVLSAQTTSAEKRFFLAHRAALRAAAAVLARHAEPSTTSSAPTTLVAATSSLISSPISSSTSLRPTSPGEPLTVWVVLSRRAPRLEEWAAFFAALAPKREALECGWPTSVTSREADDLVREARSFLDVVSRLLFGTSIAPTASVMSPVLPPFPALPRQITPSAAHWPRVPRERIGVST